GRLAAHRRDGGHGQAAAQPVFRAQSLRPGGVPGPGAGPLRSLARAARARTPTLAAALLGAHRLHGGGVRFQCGGPGARTPGCPVGGRAAVRFHNQGPPCLSPGRPLRVARVQRTALLTPLLRVTKTTPSSRLDTLPATPPRRTDGEGRGPCIPCTPWPDGAGPAPWRRLRCC